MVYCSWDMVCDICNCYFFILGYFLPFSPLTVQKIKILKNEKKITWRYRFTHVYQKWWLDDVRFLRTGARQTGGQMDEKSDTQRWVPHLKIVNKTEEGLCRALGHMFSYNSFHWYHMANHSEFFVHSLTHPLENYSITESVKISVRLNKHI